ncbi:MAG: hypothetical protein QOD35_880, partial [Nocardioidaceae bacterium]|nr:hypothetical protein [Nocardioidaceae bacterium]
MAVHPVLGTHGQPFDVPAAD